MQCSGVMRRHQPQEWYGALPKQSSASKNLSQYKPSGVFEQLSYLQLVYVCMSTLAGQKCAWSVVGRLLEAVNPGAAASILEVHLRLLHKWQPAAQGPGRTRAQELIDLVRISLREQQGQGSADAGR